jgi:flagellar motor switch protein FliN/FliY
MTMEELLELGVGSVIQLDKPANANVDVYVNQKLVARGEVVVAEENFGIRIKEVLSKPEI